MKHEQFKEWLYLSVYGELSDDENHHLSEHLKTCDECAKEREDIVRMLDSINASGAGQPTDDQLLNAQQSLRAALWQETVQAAAGDAREERPTLAGPMPRSRPDRSGPSRFERWFGGLRPALAGAAMVLVGFVMGYAVFERLQPAPAEQPVLQTQPAGAGDFTGITNVRFVDADATDGELDVVYQQVRPVRLRTRLDDERLREVLAYALLKEENPGVRLKVLSAFEADRSAAPPEDMKQAFLEALNSDPNVAVRLQAIYVLKRLPFDDEIKETLLFVLSHDDNPGVRIAAMNYLAEAAIDGTFPEQEMYDIIKNRMEPNRPEDGPARSTDYIKEAQ